MTTIAISSESLSPPSLLIPLLTLSKKPNPFALPKVDDVEAVWQKALNDSTEKVAGVDPRDAQIIFLGNIHTEKWWQREWRSALIEHYGSDPSIVLCEGWQASEGIRPSQVSSFVPTRKVYAYGWDDTQLLADKTDVVSIVKLSDKYKESAPTTRWSKEDRSYWDKAVENMNNRCMLRTHSMIKTARAFLSKGLKPGQKLFVIAGSDHLLIPEKYNVLDYFKAYKGSLILPKDTSTNKTETALEYSKLFLGK